MMIFDIEILNFGDISIILSQILHVARFCFAKLIYEGLFSKSLEKNCVLCVSLHAYENETHGMNEGVTFTT